MAAIRATSPKAGLLRRLGSTWGGNDYLYVSELAGGNDQLIRLHLQGSRTGNGRITFGSPIFSIPGSVGDGRMSHQPLRNRGPQPLRVFAPAHLTTPPRFTRPNPARS